MARTHSVELSVDSKSILIKDLTTLDEYAESAITDPVSQTTSILVTLTDALTSTSITYDASLEASDLRDSAGLSILAVDFSDGAETFQDDLWEVEVSWVFDVATLVSTTDSFFYSDIKNKAARAIFSGDWKDAFNYQSKMSCSKRALKVKSWIDQLDNASTNELLTEGKNILNSLKSVL